MPIRRTRLLQAFAWALATFLFLALPTDILPNPIFGREVPIRWWEYPTVAAATALSFAWFAIQIPPRPGAQSRWAAGITVTLFAIACPVCNKIVLLLIGASGAMGWWAPAQPFVALVAVIALAAALVWRLHHLPKRRI